ncbi:MAG TPA: acyl-CoA dehydrogenase family protein [Baekduia sp.]|nr:acyl-CoA dehydrogenase family protein [Baekduia sp.]
MTVADRGMEAGLRALRMLAGSPLLDRTGLRPHAERAVFTLTKHGFRAAGTAGRTFARVSPNGAKPVRQGTRTPTGLFDLTPDDEQQMVVESLRAFAAERLRPVAQDADAACAPPEGLAAEGAELGLPILGVPEELGGAMSERSSVTGVLAAEALAHGDMGLAVSLLAPAGVATAIARFGTAAQQQTYLPAFTGEDVAPAAVAILERRPLFDPFALETTATRSGDGWTLDGEKALVPLAASADLLLVAALCDEGPALFLVETSGKGVTYQAEPAMGVRAAGTGVVRFDGVALPEDALLCSGADYAEAVLRSRLAWCGLAAGCAKAVLDHVIPYVNERQAFGEPISHRQAVAFTVSDIAIEQAGMGLATLRAASLLDAGKDATHATAVARRLCADKGMAIGSHGVQLLGGHGYVKEYPVERWYRDLRATAIMEGGVMV